MNLKAKNKELQFLIDNNISFFHKLSVDTVPKIKWGEYRNRMPTQKEIDDWEKITVKNYGAITGKISDMIIIDIDIKSGANPSIFIPHMRNTRVVKTKTNGYHIYFKYTEELNTIKQFKPGIDSFLSAVDIMSNGGSITCPPTDLKIGNYEVINDKPIGEIPKELLDKITSEIKRLEPVIVEEKPKSLNIPGIINKDGKVDPIEFFNKCVSIEQVLEAHSWKIVGKSGEETLWQRPGKREGVSATSGYKGTNALKVFTSASGLEAGKAYSPFGIYSALYFNNNHRDAIKEIKRKFNL